MTLLSAGILGGLSNVPTDGLEAYWPLFDTTVAGGTADDQSSKENDIAAHGPTADSSGSTFDGVDDYYGVLDLGAATDGGLTLSFWLDDTSAGGDIEAPIGVADDDNPALALLARNNTDDLVTVGGTNIGIPSLDITTDSHVILKKDGSGFAVKVNDTQYDSGNQTYAHTGSLSVAIGTRPGAGGGAPTQYFYSGTMHDVAVYGRYTTDSEDTQLYEAGH